ncbi:2-C-methyl-D-erythritol 4-phosphate cytidylyltransferase [Lachnospiraceae bacterium ZAX-1]
MKTVEEVSKNMQGTKDRSNYKFTAIILAAGQGKRMNAKIQKQYLMLNDKPLIYYSLKSFEDSPVDEIILVAGVGEIEYCKEEIVKRYGFLKVCAVVAGGRERYHSVFCGLRAVRESDFVLIHDGARPFVDVPIIIRAMEGALKFKACAVGMPVKDTIKIADEKCFATMTPKRNHVWMMQTPQAFSFLLLYDGYKKLLDREAAAEEIFVTDDAMVIETFGNTAVKLIEGSYENIKITTPEDLEIARIFSKNKNDNFVSPDT